MGDNISHGMRNVNRRMPANLTPGIVLLVLVAIVLLIVLSTSFIVVDQTERAVITTFGKFTRVAQPGLTFKWPFGIQRAYHVKTEVVQTEQFGFRTDKAGVVTQYSAKEYPEESTMLTGDLNIISVEWIIQYKITDPKAWLFNVIDREKTIRDISQSVVNLLVGDRTILGVIGPERTAIQETAVQMMNEKFSEFGLGINVTQVQLQNIVPPKGVQDAFEDVNKAIQDMNRLVNEGKEAYNSEIPKAQGQAEQIKEVAQGYAAERVNNAKGDVARFNSVYDEYRKAPEVTKRRLYYEMIEDIFKGEKNVELIDKHFSNFLPLKYLGSADRSRSRRDDRTRTTLLRRVRARARLDHGSRRRRDDGGGPMKRMMIIGRDRPGRNPPRPRPRPLLYRQRRRAGPPGPLRADNSDAEDGRPQGSLPLHRRRGQIPQTGDALGRRIPAYPNEGKPIHLGRHHRAMADLGPGEVLRVHRHPRERLRQARRRHRQRRADGHRGRTTCGRPCATRTGYSRATSRRPSRPETPPARRPSPASPRTR